MEDRFKVVGFEQNVGGLVVVKMMDSKEQQPFTIRLFDGFEGFAVTAIDANARTVTIQSGDRTSFVLKQATDTFSNP